MTFDWQNTVAVALVLVAAVYLGWRGWRIVARKAGGCGACSNCPADQSPAGKPLVSLDALSPPKARQ
ncbi:MAG TPA: FeoB-associated Cys-rich membrane protein [Pirellulales bacterium]|jgi:TRAP-type C4-dicarboxylate transport system permease small subunit|nr:FeoB-associated Cys-rich membrane protein [Pirellulales bacterium]